MQNIYDIYIYISIHSYIYIHIYIIVYMGMGIMIIILTSIILFILIIRNIITSIYRHLVYMDMWTDIIVYGYKQLLSI